MIGVDGKTLTLYGRKPNVYVQEEVAGTVEDAFDWQLWVRAGDEPLPLRYVITSKLQAAAPQFELNLRDWDTSPTLHDQQFTFLAPSAATNLDAVPVEDLDDVSHVQEVP